VIPALEIAAYRGCWDRFAALVRTNGGRAWVFQSKDEPGRYIEFIEYDAGHEAAVAAGTMLAERALELIAASDPAGTWEEWTN
jgi:hypothetical protein